MNEAIVNACEHYVAYLETILRPAAESFRLLIEAERTQLHDAVSANFLAAHSIDHIARIRRAAGQSAERSQLVKEFDELFCVEGARLQNRKFQLVDATNNAVKHTELDPKRYGKLVSEYGSISFLCLAQRNNRVICLLEGYRFDYSRVVLRHVLDALVDWEFEDAEQVLEFARGESALSDGGDCDSDRDPIDQMIDYCNPTCDDCGEFEDLCQCATYVCAGDSAEFSPLSDQNFDFDHVMSQISGTYARAD